MTVEAFQKLFEDTSKVTTKITTQRDELEKDVEKAFDAYIGTYFGGRRSFEIYDWEITKNGKSAFVQHYWGQLDWENYVDSPFEAI